jgi:hypothetical protein
VAVLFESGAGDLYERLHRDELCQGCRFCDGELIPDAPTPPHPFRGETSASPLPPVAPAPDKVSVYEDQGRLFERGFYVYEHPDGEYAAAGPYGRILVPAAPITIEQIPEPMRGELEALRLDVRFAQQPFVQPAQHTECTAWGPWWIDMDGKTEHVFAGCEKEAAELSARAQPVPRAPAQKVQRKGRLLIVAAIVVAIGLVLWRLFG